MREGAFAFAPFCFSVAAGGQTLIYYRTLLEAGTMQDYYQQQFPIIDRNLDSVEDIFE